VVNRRVFLSGMAGTLVSFMLPTAAPAQDGTSLSVAEAINKAGRHRMLSQRCAKAWLMRALGVMPEKAEQWLAGSMALFDAQLSELQGLQPNTEIQALLVQLNADWQGYRGALTSTPGRDAAAEVFARNEVVLKTAHATTQAYEKLSGTRFGRLINLSGRQRMLSQRMAKFVFFAQLGVEPGRSSEGFEKARAEFVQAMGELKAASENTTRIRDELALVDQQWFFFESALKNQTGAAAMKHIATTSERMLEQLNLVVGLYEALVSRAAGVS